MLGIFRQPANDREQRQRARAYAKWYFCIAAAFVLLGFRFILLGGSPWLFALRLGIAAGFGYLGWKYWKAGRAQ